MAMIVDYTSLAQAILDFSHRANLATYQDYFIQDAQDRIYQKILELNEGKGLRWMEANLNLTIDDTSGYGAVPSDYLALKGAQVIGPDGGQYDLIQKDSQYIYAHYPERVATAPPTYIAREGVNFIFGPYPDSDYQVLGTYYQRATALSSSNPTNWMTSQMPLTLFAACMASVSKFLKDVESVQAWMAEVADRLGGIIAMDKAEQFGDGQLVIECANPAPCGW